MRTEDAAAAGRGRHGGAEEALLMACGSWGEAVADALGRWDGAVAVGMRQLRISASQGETSVPTGPLGARFHLLIPQAEAYRQYLLATDAGTARRVAPAAWLADLRGHAADSPALDLRFRTRMALVANEPRARKRIAESIRGIRRVLVVGALDEPLASGGVLLLAAWASAGAPSDQAPKVTLLAGLHGLGPDAARDPMAAARLHAALAELDVEATGGERATDPFVRRLVVGRPGLQRETSALAAAEIAAWWARGGSALEDALDRPEPARARGRRALWTAPVAATASIGLETAARAQAVSVVTELERLLLTHRTASELTVHAQHLASDLQAAIGVPSTEDVERARQEPPGGAADPALASRTRVDKALQAIATEHSEALARRRAALFGGAIQRMDGKVATGVVAERIDWAWRLVLGGRASLDDVVSALSAPTLTLAQQTCSAAARELERVAEDAWRRAAKRRREGAPPAVVAAAHLHGLRATAAVAGCDGAATLLGECSEALGRAVATLASARASVHALARLASAVPSSGSSPWHADVPLDPAGLQRTIFGEDGAARAWLADLAAESAGEPARGLGRPPDVLVEHLRRWCARRIEVALADRPIGQLDGFGTWLAGFVASVPEPARIDDAATPAEIVPPERFLFATAAEAPRLAAALGHLAHVAEGADALRIGWLAVPRALRAFELSGIASSRAALKAASAESRLLPLESERDPRSADLRSFFEPAPGDLAWRVRRALGASAHRVDEALARLESRTWTEVRPALASLRELPRESPALVQAGVFADWSTLSRLEDLAGLERGVQELERAREADSSDEDLVESARSLAAASPALKKWVEAGSSGPQAIVHLVQAAAALADARSRAAATLSGCDRVVVEGLVATWCELAAARTAALRGRSELVVTLLTRRVVAAPHATLLVEVENRGQHAALSARLDVLDSPAFRVLAGASHDLGALAPGVRQVAVVTLKPVASGEIDIELALTWDDLERAGKQSRGTERLELVTTLPPFRRIERNPYIAGPPVRSEAMFFGREDVFRFVAETLAGRHQDNILILHGQRRTGKSSILYQLERRDMLPEHLPVLVDLQGLGGFDTTGFLYQLARHAGRKLARTIEGAPALPDRAAFAQAPYDAFQEHLDAIEDALAPTGRRLLLMIDEFDALEGRVEGGQVEPEVFPFLRNLMQHRERLAFLLAGTQQLVDMRRDYWSILFSLASYRHVSCLPAKDARALVEKPLEGEVVFDDLVIESLLRLTAGHPYYLQLFCQSIVQRLNQTATHACVTVGDLEAVLPEVLAAGGGHFEHEWRTLPSDVARAALGGMASADDTGLPWFAANEIAALAAGSQAVTRADIAAGLQAALAHLVGREVLERAPGGSAWRIRIDLLRHWIRRNGPRERVGTLGTGAPA